MVTWEEEHGMTVRHAYLRIEKIPFVGMEHHEMEKTCLSPLSRFNGFFKLRFLAACIRYTQRRALHPFDCHRVML